MIHKFSQMMDKRQTKNHRFERVSLTTVVRFNTTVVEIFTTVDLSPVIPCSSPAPNVVLYDSHGAKNKNKSTVKKPVGGGVWCELEDVE
ncbi:MAG: hypothetical protein KDD36_04355 [Flavobacteriales bacterium]|nr:hypothetical protein [Flavobacteriales bacterium]